MRLVVLSAALLVFSRVFGLSMVMPGFREHFGPWGPSLWVGVAFGAHGLTMALMQWPLGALSDRIGRRPVLLGASLLFVAGSFLAWWAPSLYWLIVARLVQGLGAVSSTAMALVGESVPEARRTGAMAAIGILAGGGFFAGIAVGPILAPTIGFQSLFLVTAVVGLVAALPVLVLRPGATRTAGPAPVRDGVLALASAGFVLNFALAAVLFLLADVSWQRLLPVLLVALVAMTVVSRIVDRRGWCLGPVAAGITLLALAAPAYILGGLPYFLGGLLFFAAHATMSAVIPSQVSRLAGASGGSGHGIQNIMQYMGTFAGGFVSGGLAHAPALVFVVLGGAAVVSIAWVSRIMVATRAASIA